MGLYNGNSDVFNNSIYIFDDLDIVLGGENGISNVPIKQLTDNTSYLKKYKGSIIRGNGAPSLTLLNDYVIDADTANNVLYLDEDSGNFYKPVIVGGSLDHWINIYESVVLNVAGLKINNGDENDYIELVYNDVDNVLEIKDDAGEFSNLRVNEIRYNVLDSKGDDETQTLLADNEILLLSGISDSTGNSDGFFAVKRLENLAPNVLITEYAVGNDTNQEDVFTFTDNVSSSGDIDDIFSNGGNSIEKFIEIKNIDDDVNGYYKVNSYTFDAGSSSGTIITSRLFKPIEKDEDTTVTGLTGTIEIDNSAMIRYNNNKGYFELISRRGDLISLNCSGVYQDGLSLVPSSNLVIINQAMFDDFFTNETAVKRLDLSNQKIYIKGKDTNYTLDKIVEIEGKNISVEFADNAKLEIGENGGFRTIDNTDLWVYDYSTASNKTTLKIDYTKMKDDSSNFIQMYAGDDLYFFSDEYENNVKRTIETVSKLLNPSYTDSNTGHIGSVENDKLRYENGHFVRSYIDGSGDLIFKRVEQSVFPDFSSPDSASISSASGNVTVYDYIDTDSGYIVYFKESSQVTVYRKEIDYNSSYTSIAADICLTPSNAPTNILVGDNVLVVDDGTNIKIYDGSKPANFQTSITDVHSTSREFAILDGNKIIYNNTDAETWCKGFDGDSTNDLVLNDIAKQFKIIEDGDLRYIFIRTDTEISCVVYNSSTGSFTQESSIVGTYTDFDVLLDTSNSFEYELEGNTDLFHVFYANSNILYYSNSAVEDSLVWNENDNAVYVIDSTITPLIYTATHDNIKCCVIERQSTRYMNLDFSFSNDVKLTEEIPTLADTSLTASHNVVSNFNLKGNFDISNYTTAGQSDVIKNSNSFNNEIDIKIDGTPSETGYSVINGENKVFNNKYKIVTKDDINNSDAVIKNIKDSMIIETFINATTLPPFENCFNCLFYGFINENSRVETGDL